MDKLVDLISSRDALEKVRTFIDNNPTTLNDIIEYKAPAGRRWIGTLLHFSSLYKRPKVVSYLLSQNADVTVCFIDKKDTYVRMVDRIIGFDYDGLTAQQIAEKCGYVDIVNLFEQSKREKQAAREQAERVREQTAREDAIREQFARELTAREAAIREQFAREQAAREQTSREQAEREQAAREQAEREQAERELLAREAAEREKVEREQAAREAEREIYEFLNQLGFDDTLIQKIVRYGVRKIEDFVHFGKEDWDSLALPPFQKNKIISKISQPVANKITDQVSTVVHERGNRREPPTARISPGKRFLALVPSASTNPNDVKDGLKKYGTENHLPLMVLQDFEEKIEDFANTSSSEAAFAMALCWLYTTNSWVYSEMNAKLRDDCSSMVSLAPYMKALIESYKSLDGDESNFYSGIVYRRTKLTPKGLEFYKPDLNFVWSSFTSTSITFNPDGEFGNILFEVTIPDKFKKYALCLEDLSSFKMEREVLLLPNIAYRVVSIENGPIDRYPNTTHLIKVVIEYICLVV